MLNALWLETFTTLSETVHFTRTAEILGMTQPGVSQHLRKLEEQVGQPLIFQRGKSFTLTSAGEAVAAIGQARRKQEQSLRNEILYDDPDRGEVTVACSGSFAMLLYPAFFPVMRAAPQLVLRVEATPQEHIKAGVLKGRYDIGIISHDPDHPRLDAQRIGQEELCLVLPATADPQPLTLAYLEDLGLIAHPDVFTYADELFTANFPTQFMGSDRLNIRAFVNQISQIPASVAHGIGYTLLPRSGIDAFPDRGKLRVETVAHRRRHDLWLIAQRDRLMSARHQRIIETLRSVAGELTLE